MSEYLVYSGNMEKLKKKLSRIEKKCERYSCDFYFKELGEEFREIKDEDGEKYLARFIRVEAYGTAICETGWKVVAVIDHFGCDSGNVIKMIDQMKEYNIPDKFYHSSNICEHCNTNRGRKTTILIYHPEKNEYKQVGKSCLLDYTGGLSAELVTFMEQYIHTVEECEDYTFFGTSIETNYYTLDMLQIASCLVAKEGYIKYDPYENNYLECTRERCKDLIKRAHVFTDEELAAGLDEAEAALDYIRSEDCSGNNYMMNLQMLSKSEGVSESNVGILVSLIPTYHRHLRDMEYKRRLEIWHAAESGSKYVGDIKDKVTVTVESASLVTSFANEFGSTYLYKILSTEGNVFMWYSSRYFGDNPDWQTITGTVKMHQEYKNIKQTILTRCKGC